MPVNFNSSAPSAPTGKKDIHWQKDTTATPPNISGYFDLDVHVASLTASATLASLAIETVKRVSAGSPVVDITLTLPAASGSGAIFLIKRADSASYNVIVTRAGSDTIDGGTTYTLVNQYQYVRLLDAASGVWDVIGGN